MRENWIKGERGQRIFIFSYSVKDILNGTCKKEYKCTWIKHDNILCPKINETGI